MRILFAVNSNGLGHATRCVPLIEESLKYNHEVYILSDYRALSFLKNEFKKKIKKYFQLKDYSLQNRLFTNKKLSLNKFLIYFPVYLNEIRKEHVKFVEIQKKYKFERIVSDLRLGIYDTAIPSYLITHLIRVPLKNIKLTSDVTERAFYILKSKFKKILIPDFEEESLSGDLAHNFRFFRKEDYVYLGILSMTKKKQSKKKIDYFFSISGLEPVRTIFEKKIFSSLDKIKNKKIVIALGKPESKLVKKTSNLEIYGFLDKDKQSKMMNRAELVITMSGYTTLMDLAELEKKALLIPTKGQPEQEYLAKYHFEQGNFYYKAQDKINIPEDLDKAMEFSGYKTSRKTKSSLKKFMKIIHKG
ncbi:MAG: glycosyltransferase family protein [Nanoarchaeota archaeon]